MYPKLQKLIEKLHDRTVKGTIHWEETNKPGVFQTAFPGYTIIVLTRSSQEFVGGVDYCVQIYNDAGNLVEETKDTEFENKDYGFSLLKELYETARRIAAGTDQAIDTIISSLDDDIPF